jgi:hypothetical protein
MQRQQRVHRAHELHGGAVGALVAHQLSGSAAWRPSLPAPAAGLRPGRCRGGVGVEEALGLAVLGAFEVADLQVGEAQRGQLLGQRRARLAFLVQGDRDRQHFFADRLVGRGGAHVRDRDGQAARGGVGGDDAVGFQEVARLQAIGDAVGKGGAQFDERFRRQFFGLQFDE